MAMMIVMMVSAGNDKKNERRRGNDVPVFVKTKRGLSFHLV